MIEQANPNLPQGEDLISVPTTDNHAPGVLRGEIWLTVQSHHAQGLILGRAATLDKPAIIGLMNGALAERALRGCAGAIRRIFAVPQGYRMLRIDRQAVKAGGKAAKEAAAIMGALPQAVLLGEHAAALTPRKAQP